MSFEDGLLEAPALLRRLRSDEAPFAGDLRAGDPPTVWVRADDVPAEMWRVRAGEHVLAPLDVARTADGHDVLLPHCSAPLSAVLARSGRPLSSGAIVTVAVSVIRGAAEARRCAIVTGRWWVDADGMPLLAPAAAPADAPSDPASDPLRGDDWVGETVALLDELADGTSGALRAALEDAAALVAEAHPPLRRRNEVEEALFDAAEPSPLRWTPRDALDEEPPPRRAASLRRAGSVRHEMDDVDVGVSDPPETAWATRLLDRDVVLRAHGAVAGVSTAASRFVDAVRRRRAGRRDRRPARANGDPPTPARRHRRRAPVIVAAAVGVAVAFAGLVWPDSDSDTEAIATGGNASHGPEAPMSPTGAPAAAHADADAGDQIDGVLQALSTCAHGDSAACDAVREDPAAPPPSGVVTDDSATRDVTLLDEYGGVFVYRVTADGQRPQVLVVVDADGKWLVRDVYDVADQP